MRRLIILVVVAAAIRLVIRKMVESEGPAMRERCSEMCDRILANMPESFPPNRMMADLDALKEKTDRILELRAERQP